VEYYDTATQEALYWVRVPQVDANSTTDKIVVAYGNDPNGSDQDNPTAVWDSNFKMVQHLNDTTTSTITDSTSNANNGTKVAANNPIQAIGQVKYGQTFDGTDDSINCGTNASLLGALTTTAGTVSAWVKPTDLPVSGYQRTILATRGQETPTELGWGLLNYNNAGTQQLYILFWSKRTGYTNHTLSTSAITKVDGVFSSDTPIIYVNGTAQSTTASGTGDSTPTSALYLGKHGAYRTEYWKGLLDEVRISNSTRSADWIKLEYYSMAKTNFNGDNGVSSPFITYGAEALTAPTTEQGDSYIIFFQ